MKIAFQSYQLDTRGSCVATYDYAHYNETLLKNISIIVVDENGKNEGIAIRKFTSRFPVYFYKTKEELHSILKHEQCDVLYIIKYGKNDKLYFNDIKTVIHCVFDLSEPHGDVYAGVSENLANKFGWPVFVPHMVGLKPSQDGRNLRQKLNIPEEAIVFGRHGGLDTFDLEMAFYAIKRIIENREDIYFVFIGTQQFCKHPRIIYLDPIITSSEKNEFICTCDAMIHAQSLGETFGLSIAEFSVNNKPIITYGGWTWNDTHKKILGDKALYYNNEDELYQIFNTFKPDKYEGTDLNCYREFSPEKVMEQFKKVFL